MNTTPFRCHDADACASGQNACPTPSICGCAAPACAVKDGTHKPADAVHQIAEPKNWDSPLSDFQEGQWWIQEIDKIASTSVYHQIRVTHEMKRAVSVVHHMLRAARNQDARVAELEKTESDVIAQRDHCEEIIDRMADAVLGKDRPEWSSVYDFMDAAQEVEDRIAELESQLAAAPQAVQAAVPGDVVSDLKNALADATEVRQQLRLMEEHARGDVWRWQADGVNELESMGNRMGVLIYASDLRNLLAASAHPAEGVPAQAVIDGGTPGPWRVRKRTNDAGEVLDCFVTAPDCQGRAYDAHILGDDYDSIKLKLADAELTVAAVNAFRAAATHPTQQGLDSQTIKHISALSELVRMPNAEHFADAHNAAVRHLRALAAQAKQGGA